MIVATSPSATTPLALVTLPSRPLGPRDVRVRVRAIGVNPVDWKMREGGPLRFAHRFIGPRGPLVVGVDFAGEVIEVAPGVTDLSVGDRVVGGTDFSRRQLGSYADEVVVRPDQCAKLPASVSFERAACLPVAAVTPWIVFTERVPIGKGSRVLILGAAGGVGQFAMSLAKMLGATAVGVCSTRNVALVEKHHAIAIDYTKGDALVAARAHGPYDCILNLVGTDVYPLAPCRAMLTDRGFVDLAVVRPTDALSIALDPKVYAVLGRVTRARLEPLVAALEQGFLDPVIDETFSLADAEKAHRRSQSGRLTGKLLLIP